MEKDVGSTPGGRRRGRGRSRETSMEKMDTDTPVGRGRKGRRGQGDADTPSVRASDEKVHDSGVPEVKKRGRGRPKKSDTPVVTQETPKVGRSRRQRGESPVPLADTEKSVSMDTAEVNIQHVMHFTSI